MRYLKLYENFSNVEENVLIIDVESTCDTQPIVNEVIEIGLADTFGNSFPSIFIIPQFSKITDFCTELTTLTQDSIEKLGKSPEESYQSLNEIFSRYTKWASYGDYDKKMLDKMQSLYGVSLNKPDHENIRLLFSEKVLNSDDPQVSPKNPKDALEILGKKFQGVNHRGADDAINIAILYNIIKKY
jgi:inhibitor of KinA sporulation pathway (predicted exonuclease)